MYRPTFLAEAANLLLKSHAEFDRLTQLLSSRPPVPSRYTPSRLANALSSFGFQAGDFRLAGRLQDGTLTFEASQKGLEYRALLPVMCQSLDELSALVELSSPEGTKEVILEGNAFLTGEGFPEEFLDLHANVVDYVSSKFPWLAKQVAQQGMQSSGSSNLPEQACEERDMLIPRENGKPLKFVGKLLGSVRSVPHNGRLWELGVYVTKGGSYIAFKIGRSSHYGECARVEAEVCANPEAVQTFLGDSALSRALYAKVGFDFYELVD